MRRSIRRGEPKLNDKTPLTSGSVEVRKVLMKRAKSFIEEKEELCWCFQ